jgi:hypothetical protein
MSRRRLESEPSIYIPEHRRWCPINRGTFFQHGNEPLRYSQIRHLQKFGRLTALVISDVRDKEIFWFCRCECRKVVRLSQSRLISGQVKSCGCLKSARKDFSISVGDRFGRLTILEDLGTIRHGRGRRAWLCKCDCGSPPRSILQSTLKCGDALSCGCYGEERRQAARTKHGNSKTRAYGIWASMRSRCENPNEFAFRFYGARGISVCERWRHFENFFEDMGEPEAGLSLERVDNDGNYEPLNCVWATKKQQARNRRNSVWVSVDGEQMILVEAAARLGVSPGTIRKYRIIYDETHQQAVDRLFAKRNA